MLSSLLSLQLLSTLTYGMSKKGEDQKGERGRRSSLVLESARWGSPPWAQAGFGRTSCRRTCKGLGSGRRSRGGKKASTVKLVSASMERRTKGAANSELIAVGGSQFAH